MAQKILSIQVIVEKHCCGDSKLLMSSFDTYIGSTLKSEKQHKSSQDLV